MPHPFRVGGFYEDRKGKYEVIALDSAGATMTLRYLDSKELLKVAIALKQRIWENLQLESKQPQAASSGHVRVDPTFLPRWSTYSGASSPSPLLSDFTTQEHARVGEFWQQAGLAWDEQSELLSGPDGSKFRLSRIPEEEGAKRPSDVRHWLGQARMRAVESGQAVGLLQVILHLGRLAFRQGEGEPRQDYGLEMRAIAAELLRKPALLLDCAKEAAQRRSGRGQIERFLADELLSLYCYACLSAGPDCFISHANLFTDQIVLGHLAPLALDDLRNFALHIFASIGWKLPPDALNLLAPNFASGETWVRATFLVDCENAVGAHLSGRDISSPVNRLAAECWDEIRRDRKYGVPSHGHADVLVEHRLLSSMGLRAIRFVQEGIAAPGVHLRLHFGPRPPWQVGIVRVRPGGNVEGFHEARSKLFADVIRAVALTYYRDLVVPSQDVRYITARPDPYAAPRPVASSPSASPELRVLPRRQHEYYRSPAGYPQGFAERPIAFHEWYVTQERALHSVVGHCRWIGDDFVADLEKRREAQAAGVELPPGYTWVVEHERGGHGGEVKIRAGDLTRRTLFAPPARACTDLTGVLDQKQAATGLANVTV